MATRLQLRRDSASDWTSANPILLDGEMAVETDTGKFKVGDGVTAWNTLVYSSGIQGVPGADGTDGIDGATWLSGAVDPTTEGVDGDYFLNSTSYDVFEKISGVWTLIGNIKGADGSDGVGIPIGGTTGQVLSKTDETNFNVEWSDIAGSFIDLTDTPSSYVDEAGKIPTVKSTEDGLEFIQPFAISTSSGVLEESFETGSATVFPITVDSNTGTQGVTNEDAYEGTFSYKLYMDEDDGSYMYVTFDLNLPVDGDLKFYMKVIREDIYSSPAKILIDNVVVYNSSDTIPWTEYTQSLLAGSHTLKIGSTGTSGVRKLTIYIDNISIPAGETYSQSIHEHSNMDSITDNPDKILVSKADGTGLEFIPKSTYMQNLSDGTLPTASVDYRGQIFTVLGGTGVADISYICQKDSTDTYVWVAI